MDRKVQIAQDIGKMVGEYIFNRGVKMDSFSDIDIKLTELEETGERLNKEILKTAKEANKLAKNMEKLVKDLKSKLGVK